MYNIRKSGLDERRCSGEGRQIKVASEHWTMCEARRVEGAGVFVRDLIMSVDVVVLKGI